MPRPIYVPSSKRKPPEYTMGNEYVYADTREEYIGLFVKYPNGTKYTAPSENNPERELAVMTIADRSPNTSRYAQITQLQFYKKYEPILHYPTITAKNREAGFIDRAFAQKINEPDQIIEITVPEAYKASPGNEPSIDTNRYRIGILQWVIAGNTDSIKDRNIAAILELERKLPGIKQFLNNLFEFSSMTSIKGNLYTSGGEFVNRRTGQEYIGFYHIHPDKGPMVGAQHITAKHDYLDLITTPSSTSVSTTTGGISSAASSAPAASSTSGGGSVGY